MKLFQWQKDMLVAVQQGVFYDSEGDFENSLFEEPDESDLEEIYLDSSIFYKLHLLHLLLFIRLAAIFITSDLSSPVFWEGLKKAYLVRRIYDFPVLYYQRIFRTLITAIRFRYYMVEASPLQISESKKIDELPTAKQQS